MLEPETDLEKLRREARRWAGWEPIEVIESEEQVQESAGQPPAKGESHAKVSNDC